MSAWEPIESAPKDGTFILLFVPNAEGSFFVGNYFKRESFNHGKLTGSEEGWDIGFQIRSISANGEPTHWMRIPEMEAPA